MAGERPGSGGAAARRAAALEALLADSESESEGEEGEGPGAGALGRLRASMAAREASLEDALARGALTPEEGAGPPAGSGGRQVDLGEGGEALLAAELAAGSATGGLPAPVTERSSEDRALEAARREYEAANDERERARERDRQAREATAREEEARAQVELERAQERLQAEARERQEHLEAELAEQQALLQEEEAEARRFQEEAAASAGASRERFEALVAEQEREGAERRERAARREDEARARQAAEFRERAAVARIGRAWRGYRAGALCAQRHAAPTAVQAAARGALARQRVARLRIENSLLESVRAAEERCSRPALVEAVAAARQGGLGTSVEARVGAFDARARAAARTLETAGQEGSEQAFEAALRSARRYEHLAQQCEEEAAGFGHRRERAERLLLEASTSGSRTDMDAAAITAEDLGVGPTSLERARAEFLARQAGARGALSQLLGAGAAIDLATFAELCSKASHVGLSADVAAAESEVVQRREAVTRSLAKCTEGGSRREVLQLCREARALGGKAAQQADLTERFLNKRGTDALEALQESLRKGHIRSIEVCIAKAEELGVDDGITQAAKEQLEKKRAEAVASLREACERGPVKSVAQNLALAAELGIESALEGALGLLARRGRQCIDGIAVSVRAMTGGHSPPGAGGCSGSAEARLEEYCRAADCLQLDGVAPVARMAQELYTAVSSDRRTWGAAPLCSFAGLASQREGKGESTSCAEAAGVSGILPGKIALLATSLGVPAGVVSTVPRTVQQMASRSKWAAEIRRRDAEPSTTSGRAPARRSEVLPPAKLRAAASPRAGPLPGSPLTAELLRLNSTGCALADVTEIFLSLEGLNSMEAIRLCPSLERINLNVNAISKIEGLQGCERLQELAMKENRLTSVGGLGGLQSLVQLSVDANALADLKGMVELPGLRRFTASENKISEVGDSLQCCTALEHLDLSGNQIQSTKGLHHCEQLRRLLISRNGLEDLGGIAACKQLADLVASDNKISVFPDVWLSPFIQTLNLSGNKIQSLPRGLHMPALRVLQLQDNHISDVGELTGMNRLELLDLSFNSIEGLEQLNSFAHCHSLQKLYLNDNPVSALGETYTAAVARLLPLLTELDSEQVPRVENVLRHFQQSPVSVAALLRQRRLAGRFPLLASAAGRGPASWGAGEVFRVRALCRPAGPALAQGSSWKDSARGEWEAAAYRLFCHESQSMPPSEAAREGHLNFIPGKYQEVPDGPSRYEEGLRAAKDRCATRLQSRWRGEIARRRVKRIRSDQKDTRMQKAAVTLQAVYRGRCARHGPYLAQLRLARREKIRVAALEAEEKARAEEAKREQARARAAAEAARAQESAATRIQALWRGHAVRVNIKKIREAAKYVDDDDFDYCGVDEEDLLPPDDLMLEFSDDEDMGGPPGQQASAVVLGSSGRSAWEAQGGGEAAAPSTQPSAPAATAPSQENFGSAPKGDGNSQSPRKPPVPRLGLGAGQVSPSHMPALAGENSAAARSKQSQRLEALASEWGISDPALAEQFLKNQRKHLRQRKLRTKEQKMRDSQVRLKKFRNVTEDTPDVHVQHREVRRGAKLSLHCGEVLGPESREGRPFANAPLHSARSLALEPSEGAKGAADLRATRSSDGNAPPAPAPLPLSLDSGRGSAFLPEGRAPQVDNWTGGVAGKPAAARRAAPKKSRRFR